MGVEKRNELIGWQSNGAAAAFAASPATPKAGEMSPKRYKLMMICRNCGGRLRPTDVFCPICKIQVRCHICGNYLFPSDNFCDKCGARVMTGVGLMTAEERNELKAGRRMLLILVMLSFLASLLLIYVAFG